MNILYFLLAQLQVYGVITTDWNDIFNPIGELFLGDGGDTEGIIGNNEMVLGLFIFLCLFVFTLILGLGMLIGSVVIIPSLFAIFQFIPGLKIVVAIVCGLLLGFACRKLIGK